MSMYGDYLRERTNDDIYETEHGFATYRFLNEGRTVYIIDIYVKSDFRKSGMAGAMADYIVGIAKSRGAVELLGTVVPSARNSTDSLKVLISYGMTLMSSSNDLIVMKKDI